MKGCGGPARMRRVWNFWQQMSRLRNSAVSVAFVTQIDNVTSASVHWTPTKREEMDETEVDTNKYIGLMLRMMVGIYLISRRTVILHVFLYPRFCLPGSLRCLLPIEKDTYPPSSGSPQEPVGCFLTGPSVPTYISTSGKQKYTK